jgi:rod shape-determining protein MreB and related proteins
MLSFLKPTIYVQLSPERLTVRNVRTGIAISEIPEVAIAQGPKPRIADLGTDARLHATEAGVEVVNPFGHPRSLVSDFTVGEHLLKHFLRRIRAGSLLTLAPTIVMHPLGDPAGGFTQVEARALHEMALGAGASQLKIWSGRALSDQEILSGQFPPDGRVLS